MVETLVSPRVLRELYPLSFQEKLHLERQRKEVCALPSCGKIALIIGPCSIHNKDSALEYGLLFSRLAQKVKDTCFLVMRVYLEKSRSITGWKGLIYDPDLNHTGALHRGIMLGREILVELTKLQIPLATEFVDPLVALYFHDLITWGFIGARTTSSQPHRELASSLPFPVGFKNNLEGDVEEAIHGVLSAKTPHTFLYANDLGHLSIQKTEGNPYSHIVLRGSKTQSNYDPLSIDASLAALEHHHLPRHLMIDCAHGNSQKSASRQIEVFRAILDQIPHRGKEILGMMLESHLKAGNQPLLFDPTSLDHGRSITDPCLDWEATEALILEAHDVLSSELGVAST